MYQQQGESKDDVRVIAYASRSLTASEINYAPHKLEFLALKWAVTDKFKEYLYGENKFKVYTYNNPLTHILTTAKLDACGQRWVADLANFNFTLHYKPGSTNTVADALSRIVWPDVLTQVDTEEFESMPANLIQALCIGVICETLIDNTAYGLSVLPFEDHIPGQRGWNKDDWVQLQYQDPDLKIIAEAFTQEEANRQKKVYDRRSVDVVLNPGDLVLVRIVKWTERHKIQDRWEQEEYAVVSQPDPFLPVYRVRPISGGNIRTLHRNLLLPLGLQMKSTEDQDSSDTAFDEVREKPLAPPEVGIFPDGPSVHPSSDNLNLSLEEEVSKVGEVPSTDSETPQQTENIILILRTKILVLLKLTLMITYEDSLSFGN